MASSSRLLNTLEQKFLQCAVCLDQIRDPRSLPCLHRYCSECLETLVHQHQPMLNCPECRTEHLVPVDGVKGFKKDFHVQNIIEFVKLQKSFESKEEKLCCGCSGTLIVLAFCFKCNGYLCSDCYNFHVTNHMVKDHKPHIFSLKDLEAQSLSFENLFALNDFPRCKTHAENISHLCCKTCSNLAICVACTYGEHRNHDIEDVHTYAKTERERLTQCVSQVDECKRKVEQLKNNMEGLKKTIIANAESKKDTVKCSGEDEISGIERRILALEEQTELDVKTVVEEYNVDVRENEKRMSEEIEKVRMKWENIIEGIKETMTAKIQDKHNSRKQATAPLSASIYCIKENMDMTENSVDSLKENNLARADELSQHSKSILTRCDNIVLTAKSVLASKSNWTAAQSIGDICTAALSLCQDMVIEVPDTETLLCYTVHELKLTNVFDVKSRRLRKWSTSSMAITGDGNFVISGTKTDSTTSGIILFNEIGQIVKEKYFKYTGSPECDRVCAAFKTFQIASIFPPDEVSLFDIRDGTFSKAHLGQCPGWKKDLEVECIATDDNRIIIGCTDSRDMYVLDGNLAYRQLFTLPSIIEWPWEIALSGDDMFVCDFEGKRAFAVNTAGNFLCEFTKPDNDLYTPLSVCADHDGHAFFIWVHDDPLVDDVLVKYAAHTGQIVTTRNVAKNSIGIKARNNNGQCKLYMLIEGTKGNIKVFTYEFV